MLCGESTSGKLHMSGEAGAAEQNNTCSHQGGLCFLNILWSFCLVPEHLFCGRNSTGHFIYTGSHLFFSTAQWSRYYFPHFICEKMERWRGYIILQINKISRIRAWFHMASKPELTATGGILSETSPWQVNSGPRGHYDENQITWHGQKTKVTLYTWNASVVNHLTKDYTQAVHNTILINHITLFHK